MKQQIFIFKPGKLFSDSGSIGFVDDSGKKTNYPIRMISEIFCFAPVSMTSGIIRRVLHNDLTVHFLNKYGSYRGSLSYQSLLEGKVIQNQVLIAGNDRNTRYAIPILQSMKKAMLDLLRYYRKKGHELYKFITEINSVELRCSSRSELMGREALIWKSFYDSLRSTVQTFDFEKRIYHPPVGEINAMISFGNMVLYSIVLSSIRQAGMLPELGVLHASTEKRYSLALDIAEMFKPLAVFRTIIYLSNKKIITSGDFTQTSGYTYLNEEGKYLFLRELHRRLQMPVFLKHLKRKVTLRSLIRYECVKLRDAIRENSAYKPYNRWYECL